jgi:phosphoadenosine phosphosulfate reductase
MSIAKIRALSDELENHDAEAILRWASETYGKRVVLASSFGPEDMVLIDLISRSAANIDIFMLDTGRLHAETYELVERVRNHYKIAVSILFPAPEDVEPLVAQNGVNGFYHSVDARKACCSARKLKPLVRALAGREAWITGLRREQNVTRTDTKVVELDLMHGGLVKINPLVEWTNDQVWTHIKQHDVPYNPLHDQGFSSIGCAPCTRAIQPGEDERAGRWWWEQKDSRECGLHPAGGKS